MRIAFFWTGADIAIPQALVHSIRLVQADGVEVLQLSDPATPAIDGVDRILRSELSRDIMVARLQAYSRVAIDDEFTFFCDADSIFLNPLAIASDRDVLLSPRVFFRASTTAMAALMPPAVKKSGGALCWR